MNLSLLTFESVSTILKFFHIGEFVTRFSMKLSQVSLLISQPIVYRSMKSKATEESADGNQFINTLKSDWNTLSVAGSLALFASFARGAAFVSANAQTAQNDIAPSLTVEQARAIVAPLYEALNEPTKKDIPA